MRLFHGIKLFIIFLTIEFVVFSGIFVLYSGSQLLLIYNLFRGLAIGVLLLLFFWEGSK